MTLRVHRLEHVQASGVETIDLKNARHFDARTVVCQHMGEQDSRMLAGDIQECVSSNMCGPDVRNGRQGRCKTCCCNLLAWKDEDLYHCTDLCTENAADLSKPLASSGVSQESSRNGEGSRIDCIE